LIQDPEGQRLVPAAASNPESTAKQKAPVA